MYCHRIGWCISALYTDEVPSVRASTVQAQIEITIERVIDSRVPLVPPLG